MLKQLIGAQERKKMMLTPIKMLRIMVVRTQNGADCHNNEHIEDCSTYEAVSAYLIFVTDTTGDVCLKKIARCKFLQI